MGPARRALGAGAEILGASQHARLATSKSSDDRDVEVKKTEKQMIALLRRVADAVCFAAMLPRACVKQACVRTHACLCLRTASCLEKLARAHASCT